MDKARRRVKLGIAVAALPVIANAGPCCSIRSKTARTSSAVMDSIMAIFSCVVDPEVIVIGGGVSKAGQPLIDAVAGHYKEHAFISCKDTPIVLAKLDNDAGIYGAAKLVVA